MNFYTIPCYFEFYIIIINVCLLFNKYFFQNIPVIFLIFSVDRFRDFLRLYFQCTNSILRDDNIIHWLFLLFLLLLMWPADWYVMFNLALDSKRIRHAYIRVTKKINKIVKCRIKCI